MYYMYIRVAEQGAFSCHSSQYCGQFLTFNNLHLTASMPIRYKITYALYVGFWFKPCLSCYASVLRTQ